MQTIYIALPLGITSQFLYEKDFFCVDARASLTTTTTITAFFFVVYIEEFLFITIDVRWDRLIKTVCFFVVLGHIALVYTQRIWSEIRRSSGVMNSSSARSEPSSERCDDYDISHNDRLLLVIYPIECVVSIRGNIKIFT